MGADDKSSLPGLITGGNAGRTVIMTPWEISYFHNLYTRKGNCSDLVRLYFNAAYEVIIT